MIRHPTLEPLIADHHRGITLALRCRKQALGQIRPMGSEGLKATAIEFGAFVTRNLLGHFRAEEEILFPLVTQTHPEHTTLIQSLATDHEKIRRGAEHLASERNLGKVLFDLADLLEQHIRREERELFPLVIECFAGKQDEKKVKERIAQLAGLK
ncbi:MAG: hemerythrin domain-containing protein [Candidatus Binatia bacterium]